MELYLWWRGLHAVQRGMLIFLVYTPCELLFDPPEYGYPLVDAMFIGVGSWIVWNGFN